MQLSASWAVGCQIVSGDLGRRSLARARYAFILIVINKYVCSTFTLKGLHGAIAGRGTVCAGFCPAVVGATWPLD